MRNIQKITVFITHNNILLSNMVWLAVSGCIMNSLHCKLHYKKYFVTIEVTNQLLTFKSYSVLDKKVEGNCINNLLVPTSLTVQFSSYKR